MNNKFILYKSHKMVEIAQFHYFIHYKRFNLDEVISADRLTHAKFLKELNE